MNGFPPSRRLCALGPIAIVLLTGLATVSAAQEDPSAGRLSAQQPVAVFDEVTSISWVLVPITVEPTHPERAVELDADDVTLKVDNRPVPFDDFLSPFQNPHTLLFFQDLSGSMANSGKLEASRRIVRWFLDKAGPDDEAALTTFASGGTYVDVPITPELGVIGEHLDTWHAYGLTALHDAVTWIPQVRLTARTAPAVILITDGIDNASEIPADKARQMVKSAEVPVYVIALRPAHRKVTSQTARTDQGPWLYGELLRKLAQATGGKYVETGVDHIEAACSVVQHALHNRYSLAFRLAGDGRAGYHSIEVTAPGKPLHLRHRSGYTGTAPHP